MSLCLPPVEYIFLIYIIHLDSTLLSPTHPLSCALSFPLNPQANALLMMVSCPFQCTAGGCDDGVGRTVFHGTTPRFLPCHEEQVVGQDQNVEASRPQHCQ